MTTNTNEASVQYPVKFCEQAWILALTVAFREPKLFQNAMCTKGKTWGEGGGARMEHMEHFCPPYIMSLKQIEMFPLTRRAGRAPFTLKCAAFLSNLLSSFKKLPFWRALGFRESIDHSGCKCIILQRGGEGRERRRAEDREGMNGEGMYRSRWDEVKMMEGEWWERWRESGRKGRKRRMRGK